MKHLCTPALKSDNQWPDHLLVLCLLYLCVILPTLARVVQ